MVLKKTESTSKIVDSPFSTNIKNYLSQYFRIPCKLLINKTALLRILILSAPKGGTFLNKKSTHLSINGSLVASIQSL